jgi:hypothetical protein
MKSLSRKRQVLAASYLNNGGTMYAFPSGHNPLTGTQESGMTLRDYFAAKAMQALIHSDDEALSGKEDIAVWAYEFANLMMIMRDE